MEVEIKTEEVKQEVPPQPIVVVENPEPIQELKQEVQQIQQNVILDRIAQLEANLMNLINQLEVKLVALQNSLENIEDYEELEEVQEIPVAPIQETSIQEIPKPKKKLNFLELLAGGKPRAE